MSEQDANTAIAKADRDNDTQEQPKTTTFTLEAGTTHDLPVIKDAEDEQKVIDGLNILFGDIHTTAVSKGWWPDKTAADFDVQVAQKHVEALKAQLEDSDIINETDPRYMTQTQISQLAAKLKIAEARVVRLKSLTKRNVGEFIALVTSELSEALEAARAAKDGVIPPDDKIGDQGFDGLTAELADAVIRIADYAAGEKLPLAEAILAKIRFNKGRSYKHGGKTF